MTNRLRIGIDLGGTKIEAVSLDQKRRFGEPIRVATPRDYDGSIRAVRELVERIVARSPDDEVVVGMAVPGSVSPVSGFIRNANSTWLNDRPLAADLGAALGRKVKLENDANCFAVSEAADGAAAGARSVFGVIAGTGVGGGIVIDGKPIAGMNGIAGEWGHVPLPAPEGAELPGLTCWCGRTNCIEKWLSGPALAADHQRVTGTVMTAREIAEAADGGDAQAAATLDRHETRMARALALIVNILDPEVIVIGGGVSNIASLYPALAAKITPFVFSDVFQTRIVQNLHGDSSGVRGAAWLWPATPEEDDR